MIESKRDGKRGAGTPSDRCEPERGPVKGMRTQSGVLTGSRVDKRGKERDTLSEGKGEEGEALCL